MPPPCRAAGQRGVDLQATALANMRQHNLLKQFVMRSAASLVFLHDLCVLLPEAIAALDTREAALTSLQLMQDEALERQVGLGVEDIGRRHACRV